MIKIPKEVSTQIVNFMTPKAGIMWLWRGYISHILKMLTTTYPLWDGSDKLSLWQ